MRKKQKLLKIKVFFDASVLLSGLYSPSGASGELLRLVKTGDILGYVSDLVIEEVVRNLDKVGLTRPSLELILGSFKIVELGRDLSIEESYTILEFVDIKDLHIFVACYKVKPDFLVSLDKKHILSLRNKINFVKILTPGELLIKLKS